MYMKPFESVFALLTLKVSEVKTDESANSVDSGEVAETPHLDLHFLSFILLLINKTELRKHFF